MFDYSNSTNDELTRLVDALTALEGTRETGSASYMIVGAAARDVLSLTFDSETPDRRTYDIDLAIKARDWQEVMDAFDHLDRVNPHHFRDREHEFDMLPFGDIESDDNTIEVPGGGTLNMIGFTEAWETRVRVLLPRGIEATIPNLPAQILLKLASWLDRRKKTTKDAIDLLSLFRWASTGMNLDSLYEEMTDLESSDHDPLLAGARRSGRQIVALLGEGKMRTFLLLFDPEQQADLAQDMAGPYGRFGRDAERSAALVRHLWSGFESGMQAEPPA
jgi:predicted nucleotidyltransferase